MTISGHHPPHCHHWFRWRRQPLKLRRAEGFVKDMQSVAIPQTCIGIFSEPTHKLVSSVETHEDGSFMFDRIQPGRYRLVARYDHFGVANVLIEVGARPRGIDTTSFVGFDR